MDWVDPTLRILGDFVIPCVCIKCMNNQYKVMDQRHYYAQPSAQINVAHIRLLQLDNWFLS